VPFYNGTATFRKKNQVEAISATSYSQIFEAVSRGPVKGWQLVLSGGQAMDFNGMLAALLQWARAEQLLPGQRDRIRDRPAAELCGAYRLSPGAARRRCRVDRRPCRRHRRAVG
jgi:hypothetical protein